MGALRFKGRADLLRALASLHGADPGGLPDALTARLALALDLHPQPAKDESNDGGDGGDQTQPPPEQTFPPSPAAAPERRPPLQAKFFVLLSEEKRAESKTPAEHQGLTPLSAADCAPRESGAQAFTPLVARTRLWPALRASLSLAHGGRVDLPVLVRRMARAETLRRLPRRSVHSWAGDIHIVYDVAQRLIPYASDFQQIIHEVRRMYGWSRVHVWVVSESPAAPLSLHRGRNKAVGWRGPIPLPGPDTPVLILGDMGVLSHQGLAEAPWLDFCRRMGAGGARPIAWLPLSPRRVHRDLIRYAQVHCLVGDLRRLKSASALRPALPLEGLDSLLTRIACCVRVEPALLRSLRLMSPDTAAEPGLEGLLWSHWPVVEAGYRFCELASGSQGHYRRALAALGESADGRRQQIEILRRVLAAHAYRGRSTESVETQIWQAHTGCKNLPAELAQRVEEGKAWLQRLGQFHAQAPGDVRAYARDLFARQGGDGAWVQSAQDALAPLWLLTGSEAIPPGLDQEALARAWSRVGPPDEEREFALVQKGMQLFLEPLWPRDREGSDFLTPRNPPQPVLTLRDRLEWVRADGVRHWLALSQPTVASLALPMGTDPAAGIFELNSGPWRYRFGLLPRPSWASGWGWDSEGLHAWAPSPLGGELKLPWSPFGDAPPQVWPPSPKAFKAVGQPMGSGMSLGADLEFGLYLDLPLGNVTQRFRWIEPGEFVMGSPVGEPERDDAEGPQHLVRLSEGFWLADTACSQALWTGVMGSSPSRFQDSPQNPVERVSADDVEEFLQRVQRQFPGLKAVLPTEAEWEYACRAGTTKAYSVGDSINPDLAHYSAGRTVAVQSFQPNPWGLYQMHGNVWEMCADGLRVYGLESQSDPRGPGSDGVLAVRGGSWRSRHVGLRSAFRSRARRDNNDDSLGFRIALKPDPFYELGARAKGALQVFVSYAYADNVSLDESTPGWLSMLVDNLRKATRRHPGGSAISFWMDHRLEPQRQVNDELRRQIRDSQIILAFLSPRYLESVWCKREMQTFVEEVGGGLSCNRVFLVEVLPTKREDWHPALTDLITVALWKRSLTEPEPMTLGWPVPDPKADRDYWKAVNRLASLLAREASILSKLKSVPGAIFRVLIIASPEDLALGKHAQALLEELGVAATLAPLPDPAQPRAQMEDCLRDSSGVLIVYGQAPAGWVQAQYLQARKVLARERRGLWGGLLDGPPEQKPDHGLSSRNLMLLDCRRGLNRETLSLFVDALRKARSED